MALVLRFTQILEFLVAKGQATEMQLSHLIQVSQQTVKTVVLQINQEFVDVAKIHYQQHVYRLEVLDFDELELLLAGGIKAGADFNSSEKRMAYIAKLLIDSGTYHLIDEMSDVLAVSRGTIQKDLKKLSLVVKSYHASLDSKPNRGVRLLASEVNKRLIFVNHVYDFYQYELGYDPKFFSLLDALYDQLNLNAGQVALLERELLFSIHRISQGYIIEEQIENYINFASEQPNLLVFFNKLEDELKRNLTQYEQDFMAYPLNMNNNFPFDTRLLNKALIHRLINQITKDIFEDYPIQISRQALIDALQYHVTFLINRTVCHYQEKNIFFKSIQARYPFAYQLAQITRKSIWQVTDLMISDIELNTLAIYFELLLSKVRIDSPKQVALVASVGPAVRQVLRHQIQMIFGEEMAITMLTEEAVAQDFSEYIAVFTTIPLKAISPDVMEIQVANLLDEDFVTHQMHSFKESVLLEHAKIDISILHLENDYAENLAFMLSDLRLQGKVDATFSERVMARSQKSSIIFDETFAFPHTINVGAEQIVLSIGVSPDDQIKLIFLLGVPDTLMPNSESDLIKVYDMIFEIIGDESLSTSMIDTTSSAQLLGVLKRKGVMI